MLGLQVSDRVEMMENIVENCSYLIQNVGFVPNASRTHFLSRSQPPYFSLMLELLVETKMMRLFIQNITILWKRNILSG